MLKVGESMPAKRSLFRLLFSAGFITANALLLCVTTNELHAEDTSEQSRLIKSPDGSVALALTSPNGHLHVSVSRDGTTVLDSSPLAMVVDGVNLSEGAEITKEFETYSVDEEFPWHGGKSTAKNHCIGTKIPVRHGPSGTNYTLEVRAYDDGVAYRHVIPGRGERTPDEVSEFKIPAGSTVWYHDFHMHYETAHAKKDIAEVKEGTWAAPPLTFKLADDGGYASITEGALANYSGMGLQADGDRGFVIRLGHAQPINYPYELRYGKENAERLQEPATIDGEITTAWRVVFVGKDLNTLVNSDIVNSVSPPPDKELFPEGIKTDWLKPGRCVWRYLDGGESSIEGQRDFSRWAGELGFEYNLLEGFWRRWSREQLRDFVEYSRGRGVGIWVWLHSRDLRTPEAREEMFQRCQDAGVVGVKIDFLDHEAKEVIDLYHALLRDSAKHKLMANFHGANKPAGESRTWPNEMTREAVLGMESSRFRERARHDTTLPFTRFLAGHADYTAVHFGERRRDTTWAHQVASAAVFTSPVFVYGAHPRRLLENPAVEMIKSIPSVWDESVVLKESEIGELAAFARRDGETWFLAILNGPAERKLDVSLASFLPDGQYEAMLVRDDPSDSAAVKVETDVELGHDD